MDLANIFDDDQEAPTPNGPSGSDGSMDPFLMQGDEQTWTMEEWNWDAFNMFAAPKETPSVPCCTALKRKKDGEAQQQQHQQALAQQQQQQQQQQLHCGSAAPSACCAGPQPLQSHQQQQHQQQQQRHAAQGNYSNPQQDSCCSMAGMWAPQQGSLAGATLYSQLLPRANHAQGTCQAGPCGSNALGQPPASAAAAVAVGGWGQNLMQADFGAFAQQTGLNPVNPLGFGTQFPGLPQVPGLAGPMQWSAASAAAASATSALQMPAQLQQPHAAGYASAPGGGVAACAPAMPPGYGAMPSYQPPALPPAGQPSPMGSTGDTTSAVPAVHVAKDPFAARRSMAGSAGDSSGNSGKGHGPASNQHQHQPSVAAAASRKHKLEEQPAHYDSDHSDSDGEGEGAGGPVSDHNSADLEGVISLNDITDGHMVCQVPGCGKDLTGLKEYHQRYRICEVHIKLPQVVKDRRLQRFCQQCGRFHELSAFDGNRKSCRDQLSKHNARRRRRAQVEQQKAKAADATAASAAALNNHGGGAGAALAAGGPGGTDGEVGKLLSTLMSNPTQLHALRLLLGVQTHPALPTPAAAGAAGAGAAAARGDAVPESASYRLAREVVSGRGEFAPAFSSEQRSLRISMKLFNKTPADLPLDLKAQVTTWLSTAPVGMEACIRPGCVFLTVQALVDAATYEAATAPGCANSLVHHLLHRTSCPFWWSGTYAVQVGKEIVRVQQGKVRGASNADSGTFPVLTRVGPLAVRSGRTLTLRLTGTNLDLPNSSLVLRWRGRTTKVPLRAQQGGGRAVVALPALPEGFIGPVWVEVERGAWLSPAHPVLAVDSEELEQEINRLETRRVLRTEAQHCLAVDLGVVLQHIKEGLSSSGTTVTTHAVSHSSQQQQTGVNSTSAVAGSGSDVQQHARVSEAARRLLAFACDMGWSGVAQRVLPLACAQCSCAAEMVAAIHASTAHQQGSCADVACKDVTTANASSSTSTSKGGTSVGHCGGLSLLHRAVRSGSFELVQGMLAWGDAHGYKWRVDCRGVGESGLTPLHLAALLKDPRIALLLLDHCAWPAAFTHLRTCDGVTPFHLAFQMGHFAVDAALLSRLTPASTTTAAVPAGAGAGTAKGQVLHAHNACSNNAMGGAQCGDHHYHNHASTSAAAANDNNDAADGAYDGPDGRSRKRARVASSHTGVEDACWDRTCACSSGIHQHNHNGNCGSKGPGHNHGNDANHHDSIHAAAAASDHVDPCEVCQSNLPPLLLSIAASCGDCGRRRACLTAAAGGSSNSANGGANNNKLIELATSMAAAAASMAAAGDAGIGNAGSSRPTVVGGGGACRRTGAAACNCGKDIGPAAAAAPYGVCASAAHSTRYSITALCQGCHANRLLVVA